MMFQASPAHRRKKVANLARPGVRTGVSVVSGLVLVACAQHGSYQQAPESAPILLGPAISSNSTPLDATFECLAARMPEGAAPFAIGVGEVRDYTAKSSINEGAIITQGGSLMVMSALGKLKPAVTLHERFDPRVGELELIYTDRRQLGSGRMHPLESEQGRLVPWIPYFGGTIIQSDYFVVGGVTELNYAIQSGGFSARVSNIGPRARSFTLNVAADMRIVDTKSLIVAHTVSLQKQVVGFEVDADVFRFFGSRLFDITLGTRNLEPIQLAVRVVLELAVLELVAKISGLPLGECLYPAVEAGLVSAAYVPPVSVPPEPTAPPRPKAFRVFFDFNSAALSGEARRTIADAAEAIKLVPETRVQVVGNTDNVGSASYNEALSLLRANAVADELERNGVDRRDMVIVGRGFEQLLVTTPDGTPERRNRRVEIILEDPPAAAEPPPVPRRDAAVQFQPPPRAPAGSSRSLRAPRPPQPRGRPEGPIPLTPRSEPAQVSAPTAPADTPVAAVQMPAAPSEREAAAAESAAPAEPRRQQTVDGAADQASPARVVSTSDTETRVTEPRFVEDGTASPSSTVPQRANAAAIQPIEDRSAPAALPPASRPVPIARSAGGVQDAELARTAAPAAAEQPPRASSQAPAAAEPVELGLSGSPFQGTDSGVVLRRPDAEMRPPIPSYLEQPLRPGMGRTQPSSLYGPGGRGTEQAPPPVEPPQRRSADDGDRPSGDSLRTINVGPLAPRRPDAREAPREEGPVIILGAATDPATGDAA